MIEEIQKNMYKLDDQLSEYACLNKEAVRFLEEEEDIRPPFFHDADRILYSLSYTRYLDKTQVFTNPKNDHISKRMTHVQLVSKIARTIGRALNLNEDLIEAIALGHDLGHVPFGHVGEKILNDISVANGMGFFNHNVQSVRTLMTVEHQGRGSNITYQVLDGILCHNGEFIQGKYLPKKKTKEMFLKEYHQTYKDSKIIHQLTPCTLEGCVVRISDIIGYLGKDIEDACTLGVFNWNEIPKEITKTLGNSNREIVNAIILDIIKHSVNKPYLLLSDSVYQAIVALKNFNYQHIYLKANSKEQVLKYKEMFEYLFGFYLRDIENENRDSLIYKNFLDMMSGEYRKIEPKRQVIDYLAGMTDEYFLYSYEIEKGSN